MNIKYYKVICPICGSKYKEFDPFGVVERKNSKCCNCGSLERHRLQWLYLKTKNLLNNKIKLLHFSPENCFYNIFSKIENIEYFPCSLSGEKTTIKVDIKDIPYKDNYFDAIICNHVLEHVDDDNLAMSELFRVIKKNGWGIFQVPINNNLDKTYEDLSITDPKIREIKFGQFDHVRLYGKDYKEKLEKAGFTVNQDNYAQTFSEENSYKFGISRSESIYFCTKK
jgi:SAM-dependent methyltransferase